MTGEADKKPDDVLRRMLAMKPKPKPKEKPTPDKAKPTRAGKRP